MSVALYLQATKISAQVFWSHAYGELNGDWIQCIQQTADGGYIAAGYTQSFGAGNSDMIVIKMNEWGNITWQKTYGGTGTDVATWIIETSDGGFAVSGRTTSFGAGNFDVWILKLDSAGTVIWQKTYGGSSADTGNAIKEMAGGNFIVAGNTVSYGAGNYDYWIFKIDGSGTTILWQKTFGGSNLEIAYSVDTTSDGGCIVAGDTFSFGAGTYDFWVIKFDSGGSVTWQKTYGGAGWDVAYVR